MTNSAPNEGSSTDPVDWDALARYLAGESSTEEAAAMRDWLAARPDRAELVAALDEAIERSLDRGPSDVDVEAALARVTARLDEPDVRPLSPPRHSLPKMTVGGRRVRVLALQAAAAVVLVAGAATLWRATRSTIEPPATAQSYASEVGSRDSVRLPDGTRVLLAPGSRLTVAAGYGESRREVMLAGEAYFDVHHDSRRPFTVRIGDVKIVDVGTAFTVRADAGGGVSVGVTAGAVSVSRARAGSPAPVVLRPGDRAVLAADGGVEARPGTLTPDDTAWTQGRLVFRDAPLSRVREDLRRWYGVTLDVPDSTLARRHLTASFEGEPLDRVVHVIGLALGANVVGMRGDTVVLHTHGREGVGP